MKNVHTFPLSLSRRWFFDNEHLIKASDYISYLFLEQSLSCLLFISSTKIIKFRQIKKKCIIGWTFGRLDLLEIWKLRCNQDIHRIAEKNKLIIGLLWDEETKNGSRRTWVVYEAGNIKVLKKWNLPKDF